MSKRRPILRSAAAVLLSISPRLAGQEDPPTGDDKVELPAYRLPVDFHRAHSLVLEDRYRELLAEWCRGSATALEVSELELLLADRMAGLAYVRVGQEERERLGADWKVPVTACFQSIEGNTRDELTEIEPEALFALAALSYEVYLAQKKFDNPWWARNTRRKTEALLEDYLARVQAPEARRGAALLLTLVAYAAAFPAAVETYEESRAFFERALVHDPELDAARYWSGVLAEKLGDARGASSSMEALAERHPEDAEARLRLALNTARRGRWKESLALLEPLAEEEGAAEWMRILATQEAARLYAEHERSPDAVGLLERGVERYPRNARLAVQLSHLVTSDWKRSSALAERLLEEGDRGGETPRVRYERPRLDELIDVRQRLEQALARHRPLLERSLDVLAEVKDSERTTFEVCRGLVTEDEEKDAPP